MPRLTSFYGIVIWMYRPDHPPPHLHARYGEDEAQVEVGTWRVINGSRAARALRLVRERAELHENELQDNWQRAALEPLVRSIPFPSMKIVLRVTDVAPLDHRRLRVSFNDGAVGEVDCSFLFHGTLGEALRDPAYFKQVRVDEEGGTVVSPNRLDPAPELLHGDYEPPSFDAPQARRARV